jgi:putative transferase (TIGR04331 family)
MEKKYSRENKVQKDFAEMIKLIYPVLNRVHKIKKTKQYWETILFHWLKGFLVYYYSNKKKKNYKDKINYIFKIKDTEYFLDKLYSNEKLFNEQFNYLIHNFKINSYKFIYYNFKITTVNSVKFFVKKILWIFFSIIINPNLYLNSYFDKNFIYKIILKTKLKLLPLSPIANCSFAKIKKTNLLRNKLKKNFTNFNKNLPPEKKKLLKFISIFLPVSFLENYKKIIKKNKSIIKFNPPNIFVEGVHVKNDQLNIIISEWVERGSLLYSIQEAANDINFKINSFNQFNINYVSKFISWGIPSKKNITLPSLRLLFAIERIKKIKKKLYDIIFFSRIRIDFPTYSFAHDLDLFKNYLPSLKKLMDVICSNRKIKLAIKYKSLSNKINYGNSCSNIFHLEGHAGSLYNSAKLNVFAHLSNGFIECIFSNIPAVLYLPNKNYLTQESNSLKELNQLLDKYNLIYDNEKKLIEIIKKKKRIKFIKHNIKKIQKDITFKKFYLNPTNGIDVWEKHIKIA